MLNDTHINHTTKDQEPSDFRKLFRRLTKQEIEICKQLKTGKKNTEIGKSLFIVEKTVKFHITNIFKKFGVTNRTELAIKLCNHWDEFETLAYLKSSKIEPRCPIIDSLGKNG